MNSTNGATEPTASTQAPKVVSQKKSNGNLFDLDMSPHLGKSQSENKK